MIKYFIISDIRNFVSIIKKIMDKEHLFSNNRSVYNIDGLRYRTTTWFFRPDINWDNLCKFIDHHFRRSKQVTVINIACSDGKESYTLVYKLKINLKQNAQKFLPVYASDIDLLNIKCAQKGIYLNKELSSDDTRLIEIEKNKPQTSEEFKKYFKEQADFSCTNYAFKVSELLRKDIIFEQNDALIVSKNLKKNDYIILLRNCLPYLKPSEREQILKNLNRNISNKSVIVLGDFDTNILFCKNMMRYYGFVETKIKYVYKKMSNYEYILTKILKFIKTLLTNIY